MRLRGDGERGFTLVELMIAMVVTLIVTGAIYGLLAGGQNAFRREPELTDRQQNIRTAMDMIMRDISTAGSGMPNFIQTFTTNLNATAASPMGASNEKADELEIMANPNNYDPEQACDYPGGNASHARLRANNTRAQPGAVVMILLTDGTWTMRNIDGEIKYPNTGAGDCAASTPHADVLFNPGNADRTGYNQSGGLCAGNQILDPISGACVGCATQKGVIIPGNACCIPNPCKVQSILQGEIIRYRIRNDANGVPNLERFSSGTNLNFIGGVEQFQLVARGIDDLQVTYEAANGVVTDNAPIVDSRGVDYNTLIQSVTVTLSARSEAQNVAGETTSASGKAALRGMLTSTGSPRAALAVLGTPVAQRAPGWVGPSPWY